MTMIPTRYHIITVSRAADGGYLLRVGESRWVLLDRPSVVQLVDALEQLLAGRQGRQEVPARYPTDTITLAYATDGGYGLRIGTGPWKTFLNAPELQKLRDAFADLLAESDPRGPKGSGR